MGLLKAFSPTARVAAFTPPASPPAQRLLFAQHGMTDTNRTMAALARAIASPHCLIVAPDLGYFKTLFSLEPLLQTVAQAAEQAWQAAPQQPARIVATSLGGVIWVELLTRYPAWRSRIESLVLLGSPLGGADLARMIDPLSWGLGIAKELGKNRRPLAEAITAVIPTLVVAGNVTGGGDRTVPLESTKLAQAHFVCLPGVSHPALRYHPAVIEAIRAFWAQPRQPLPPPAPTLLQALITHFRRVPGITDASERDFPKAQAIITYPEGTSVRVWTNRLGVRHVFIADAANRCHYSGFVGWVHTAGLDRAVQACITQLPPQALVPPQYRASGGG